MSETSTQNPINPLALNVAQLAKMLALPEDKISAHLAAGAPANGDGRINMVHYAAWLNRRLSRNDGD